MPALLQAACLLALGVLPGAPPASALSSDSEQPIHIITDEAIRDETTGLTQYRGSVQIRQGTLLIEADEVTLVEAGKAMPAGLDAGVTALFDDLGAGAGPSPALRIIARGQPARTQQVLEEGGEPVHATAGLIGYLRAAALLRLREGARVYQGDTVMRGHTVEYLINRQTIRARAAEDGSERVSTQIPPERLERDDTDSQQLR
jgi:lipopolysaccharide export system protein LptA